MTFMILIHGVVAVATVYDNSLVCNVTTNKSFQNVNNILIANLEVSNIVIGVIFVFLSPIA